MEEETARLRLLLSQQAHPQAEQQLALHGGVGESPAEGSNQDRPHSGGGDMAGQNVDDADDHRADDPG